jgi:hypothetical protein
MAGGGGGDRRRLNGTEHQDWMDLDRTGQDRGRLVSGRVRACVRQPDGASDVTSGGRTETKISKQASKRAGVEGEDEDEDEDEDEGAGASRSVLCLQRLAGWCM